MTVAPPSVVPRAVRLDGIGLRSGRPATVVLHARPGPFAFVVEGVSVARARVAPLQAERATVVRVGEAAIATVEHLLAACAARGLHQGLAVEIHGGELPLLDGAAAAFGRALDSMDLTASPPPLRILRDGVVEHGESRYTFRRPLDDGEGISVEVKVVFEDARLAPDAAWGGDRGDFSRRFASARTFAFSHEVEALAERGLASHVDPASVVVITPDAILTDGAPFTPDEPARHKLLDLIGDLFLHGGPPRGSLHALRPGHAVTHAIIAEARVKGILG